MSKGAWKIIWWDCRHEMDGMKHEPCPFCRIQQLETKAAALYTLAERTCGDGCHCMKENNEKCALLETDNGN